MSYKPLTRLSGISIQYYYACKRELWFHLHYFEPEQEHTHLSLGRLIHETSYAEHGKHRKQIMLGNSVLDLIQKDNEHLLISEIKKSSKFLEPAIKQLQYYLYLMKQQGIQAKGIIRIPKERKTRRITLTPRVEEDLKRVIQEIDLISQAPVPPPYQKKSYCKGCAFQEFCEA